MPGVDVIAVFANVNYFAAVAAGLAGFVFGAVWHWVLRRLRSAALDKPPSDARADTQADARPSAAFIALALAANIVMAMALYGIMLHMSIFNPASGAFSALLIWIGFILPAVTVNYAFQERRLTVFFIDAGHWLGVMAVQGAVIGALAAPF